MSQPVTYQIIATGRGPKAGNVLRFRAGAEPFLIGSGEKADLRLDDPNISPVQARVIITSKGQPLLINLGTHGAVRLNGEPVSSFTPSHWKPGLPVQIGDFELQIVTVDVEGEAGQLERVRPALVTQDNEIIIVPPSENAPQFVVEWSQGKPPEPEIPVGKGTVLFTDEEIAASLSEQPVSDTHRDEKKPDTPPSVRPIISEQAVLDTHREEKSPDTSRSMLSATPKKAYAPVPEEFSRTPTMPFSFDGRVLRQLATEGAVIENTLPKDWRQSGRLSAQMTINPVVLSVGQRVRVPISVRNAYEHAVNLRTYAAGLPREAVFLPDTDFVLEPGELSAFEIVLQPKIAPPEGQAELLLRLSDPLLPDVVLTLTLQVLFKDAPNITGWFDPPLADETRGTYLHLQNHTQASAEMFVSGHAEETGLHVIPSITQLNIPSGQVAKVAVRIDVVERPRFLAKKQPFSVSVRQGNRAPLDYPGIVRVRPRYPLQVILPTFIVLLTGLAILLIFLSRPVAVTQFVPPTNDSSTGEALPTSLVVPLVIPTSEITPELESTATQPLPTDPPPTEAPSPIPIFNDPRPDGCTASVPEGWKAYVVERGDRVFRLALAYGTTVDEVARVNCMDDPRVLRVGQVLLLPLP